MKTKTLVQSVLLRATPHEVYEALMDSKKHAQFTHSPAIIGREVAREFSTFDGWASGTTLELIPDKKIVQKWRAADWPQGYYSTVTFELQAQGQETRLDFTQSDIPEDLYEELEAGWAEYYWDNLVAYFGWFSQNIAYVQQVATGACMRSIGFYLPNTQLGNKATRR